jgi:hypothetical protein
MRESVDHEPWEMTMKTHNLLWLALIPMILSTHPF